MAHLHFRVRRTRSNQAASRAPQPPPQKKSSATDVSEPLEDFMGEEGEYEEGETSLFKSDT